MACKTAQYLLILHKDGITRTITRFSPNGFPKHDLVAEIQNLCASTVAETHDSDSPTLRERNGESLQQPKPCPLEPHYVNKSRHRARQAPAVTRVVHRTHTPHGTSTGYSAATIDVASRASNRCYRVYCVRV